MKVGDLRRLLEGVYDSVEVVVRLTGNDEELCTQLDDASFRRALDPQGTQFFVLDADVEKPDSREVKLAAIDESLRRYAETGLCDFCDFINEGEHEDDCPVGEALVEFGIRVEIGEKGGPDAPR